MRKKTFILYSLLVIIAVAIGFYGGVIRRPIIGATQETQTSGASSITTSPQPHISPSTSAKPIPSATIAPTASAPTTYQEERATTMSLRSIWVMITKSTTMSLPNIWAMITKSAGEEDWKQYPQLAWLEFIGTELDPYLPKCVQCVEILLENETSEELKRLSMFEALKVIEGEVYGFFFSNVSRRLLERLDNSLGDGVVKAHILIPPGSRVGDLNTFKKLKVEYAKKPMDFGPGLGAFMLFVDAYNIGKQFVITGYLADPDHVFEYMLCRPDEEKDEFFAIFKYLRGELDEKK